MKNYILIPTVLLVSLAISNQYTAMSTQADSTVRAKQKSTTVFTKGDQGKQSSAIKGVLGDLSDSDLKEKCRFRQVDLNGDGRKELYVRRVNGSCGGGGRCGIWVGRLQSNQFLTILDGTSTSSDFVVLNTKTNGWKDIATRSYRGEEFWSVWKFDNRRYNVVGKKGMDSIPSSKIIQSRACSELVSP
jgi:hypothetical protein